MSNNEKFDLAPNFRNVNWGGGAPPPPTSLIAPRNHLNLPISLLPGLADGTEDVLTMDSEDKNVFGVPKFDEHFPTSRPPATASPEGTTRM